MQIILAVFFSIGGANDPGKSNWSTVLASPSARTNLVNNIYNYCVNYGYDGVDIDWEFPRAADKANFTAFMTELYNKFKSPSSIKGYDGQPLEVSFYTSPGWYDDRYDFAALANVVDYCIQSGYDWGNPANAPLRNPGVTIESAAHYIFEASIDGFGKNVIARGFPPNKFILGLPMYCIQLRDMFGGKMLAVPEHIIQIMQKVITAVSGSLMLRDILIK